MELIPTSRKLLIILLLGILFLFTSACDEGSYTDFASDYSYEIDPLFREFYDHLGGMETLGPAISPLFLSDNVKYQYTTASLMVHDPQAPASQRFHLAPLGLDLGISEPPIAPPTLDHPGYVDGHIIFEEFRAFYDEMGGPRYIGRPITEMHFNPDSLRYEQHFENVGLYRLDGEPLESIHLLAYGVWKCKESCLQPPVSNSLPFVPPRIGELFAEAVSRLGSDFAGYALTDPYLAPDGAQEQVFENLVLITDLSNPGRVILRPIAQRLGILPDPFAVPSGDPNLFFYPVQGEQGFNVSRHFLDYMALHGGMEISGPPISELTRMNDRVYRQCFTNICLEEHQNTSGSWWIRPAPLGYTYKALSGQGFSQSQPQAQHVPETGQEPAAAVQPEVQPETLPTPLPEIQPTAIPEVQPTPAPEAQPTVANFTGQEASRELSVQIWEIYPMIAPDQSQEIGVSVFENNVPLQMIEPDLIVTLPDGGTRTYYMYPTGADGQTRLQVDPIAAPNGTLIPYQVCVFINLSDERFCVKDSFLIWQNP